MLNIRLDADAEIMEFVRKTIRKGGGIHHADVFMSGMLSLFREPRDIETGKGEHPVQFRINDDDAGILEKCRAANPGISNRAIYAAGVRAGHV